MSWTSGVVPTSNKMLVGLSGNAPQKDNLQRPEGLDQPWFLELTGTQVALIPVRERRMRLGGNEEGTRTHRPSLAVGRQPPWASGLSFITLRGWRRPLLRPLDDTLQ